MTEQIKGVHIERLSRALMRRSMRLLNMEYKPTEVAEELGATRKQVIRLITAGAPARKDATGHFWINGEKFVKWLEEFGPKGPKAYIAENEVYCLGCRRVVTFIAKTRQGPNIFGECPEGHKTSRFIKRSNKKKGKKQS